MVISTHVLARYQNRKIVHSRAVVLVPKIDAFERFRANDVGARLVRGTIPFQVSGHRCLTPLRPVHGGWQRQMLPLQSYIVETSYFRDRSIFNQHLFYDRKNLKKKETLIHLSGNRRTPRTSLPPYTLPCRQRKLLPACPPTTTDAPRRRRSR